MKNLLFSIFFVSIAIMSSCKQQASDQKISQEEVSRILKTLSSDDMMGRRAFTEGADLAADFLANEFNKIGIGKLTGEDSYLQEFAVHELTPISRSLSINGKSISEEKFFTGCDKLKEEWSSLESVTIEYIKAEDDFRSTYSGIVPAENPTLVIVDPAHAETFDRFQRFFKRPERVLTIDQKQTVICALGAFGDIKSLSVEISNSDDAKSLKNVVAMIPGKRTDEMVVFSGHYDHLGIGQPVEGDSIFNGANDDASGVTAVVALAKRFSQMEQPERTIIFAAFTAEEIGGYGSKYFSQQLDPDQIVAMFNIEMIGQPYSEGQGVAWITGFDKSDFGTILQKSIEGTTYKFLPDPYPEMNLFYRSDNATLARLGVPAHTISTSPMGDGQDHYHMPSDEFETIDTKHMSQIIEAIRMAAETIVGGDATPQRIDKSQID